jgi:hypothetical protein
MPSGPVCTVSEEVQDWCFEKNTVDGWDYPKIAQALFDSFDNVNGKEGWYGKERWCTLNNSRIENLRRPGQVVHDSTIMRWINASAQRRKAEEIYCRSTQRMIQARSTEALVGWLHEIRANDELETVRDKLDWAKLQRILIMDLVNMFDAAKERQRTEVKYTGKFDERPMPSGATSFLPDLQKKYRDNAG